jgi:hypothetical protein
MVFRHEVFHSWVYALSTSSFKEDTTLTKVTSKFFYIIHMDMVFNFKDFISVIFYY